MKVRLCGTPLVLLSVLAFFVQVGSAQSDRRAIQAPIFDAYLAQLVAGEGWKTILTIINLDSEPASFTLRFYGDGGLPRQFTIVGSGTVSSLQGNLTINGSTTIEIVETSGFCSPVCQGWAHVDSRFILGGQAILQFSPPSSSARHESAVPLVDNLASRQVLPFNHLNGFKTGLAAANTGTNGVMTILLAFLDESGNEFGRESIELDTREHTAFFLDDRYPATRNRRGTVLLESMPDGMILLGLRVGPDGIATTLFPVSSPLW